MKAKKKPKKKEKVIKTDITIVLDRFGSMSAVRSDTIGGFNQFLLDQQKNNPNATLTMVQFDNEYEPVHRAEQRVAMPRRTIPRLITSFPTKTGMTKKNI